MRHEQARNDERDNRRVFRFGIAAAIVVLVLALAYNFIAHRRTEGLNEQGTTQMAPQPPADSTPSR